MGIYAALAVPEIWRLDGPVLSFHVLGADGRYAERSHSAAFPLVAPADLVGFLALRSTLDENAVVRQFRDWVRQRLAASGAALPRQK